MNRPEKHIPTLRRRLLTYLLLPLSALLVLSLISDYRLAYEPAQEAYDHALSDNAIALSHAVQFNEGRIEVVLPKAAEAILRSDSTDVEYLSVFNSRGDLLAGDADLLPDSYPGGGKPVLSNATLHGQNIRKATYQFDTAGGEITVTVAETVRKRKHTGSKILVAMVSPNVLLIFATLAMVYFGVRRGLKPLTQLSEAISRRQPHDLSPLPPIETPGEAEPLVRAMDGLIGDLRLASTAQQTFLATAAHQLKTPLASLQTQLELLADELPESQRARVERLSQATERVAHMAHQLLALARSAPEANLAYEFRRIDLADVIRGSASGWFDLALSRGSDLGFEPDTAIVMGSEWLLRELIFNLIDNAVRYTQSGGAVTVRCGTSHDASAFFEVEDNGPGIAECDRAHIFERFYRPLGSQGQGTGLGLAIVREVADRHAANIQLRDATPTGAIFRIVFPPA